MVQHHSWPTHLWPSLGGSTAGRLLPPPYGEHDVPSPICTMGEAIPPVLEKEEKSGGRMVDN